jgi:hypothetical protein
MDGHYLCECKSLTDQALTLIVGTRALGVGDGERSGLPPAKRRGDPCRAFFDAIDARSILDTQGTELPMAETRHQAIVTAGRCLRGEASVFGTAEWRTGEP